MQDLTVPIDIVDETNLTPLLCAVIANRPRTVKLLLKEGAGTYVMH